MGMRLAHQQIRHENIPYTKQKLEEYALSYVRKDLKCFECMESDKACGIKKLEEEKK